MISAGTGSAALVLRLVRTIGAIAAALRSTLHTSSAPAVSGLGAQVSDTGLIASTSTVVVTFDASLVAVITTFPEGAAADADAENAPAIAPAGIITIPGTVTAAVLLVSAIVIPPTGAALLRLTVHVVVPPGKTDAGAHLRVCRGRAAMTVNSMLLLTDPVWPATVAIPVLTGEDVAVNCAVTAPPLLGRSQEPAPLWRNCSVQCQRLPSARLSSWRQLAVEAVVMLVGEHVRLASVDATAVIPVLTALPLTSRQ